MGSRPSLRSCEMYTPRNGATSLASATTSSVVLSAPGVRADPVLLEERALLADGQRRSASWSTTPVAMPWVMRLGAAHRRASGSRKPPRELAASSAWEWMSMKPGATILPRALITCVALEFSK